MISLFIPAACRAARSRMLDGIAGRLGVRARLDVQDHVGVCGACARELADLVASTNASRRALERYRRLHVRVAPGRARLIAYDAPRLGRFARLVAITRRVEPLVGVALLMLVVVGSGSATQSVSGSRLPAHHYTRAADDPGGLIHVSTIADGRIPVLDGIVIDERSLPAPSGSIDRHAGPQ